TAQTDGNVPSQGDQHPHVGSDGITDVIRPPLHVDPGIKQPPPPAVSQGTDPMPVLRPPGAAGGNPDVVPK
ncbi:MAG TPA: hypothetical protein VFN46_08090, partial [Acetobacteraceae bacterium]|nr:hypothetical protein [Acetobacteraceae bacterium]